MVKIALELECIYNCNAVRINHIKGFDVRGDGSLLSRDEFIAYDTCECVSLKPYSSKQGFLNHIKRFKNAFSLNGKYELKDVLSFNDTCGCHFHFSDKNLSFLKKVPIEVLIKARHYFFKHIKNSKVLNDEIKQAVLRHYYRKYAKKITSKTRRTNSRYLEFNFLSETINKGFEWRSFSLLSVKRWCEFDELIKIMYNSCVFLLKQARNFNLSQRLTYDFKGFEKDINEMVIIR